MASLILGVALKNILLVLEKVGSCDKYRMMSDR
jgi:hypothetical protein